MSRLIGAHTADPCPRCRYEAVRLGTPVPAAGHHVVGYACDRCGKTWSRPVERDLDEYDVVRADLPEATLYGTVRQVDGDRIRISGDGGTWQRWVERWRVIVY
ncbi:hypothetical protein [Streptomyces liangshanensis]|uniref:hypothetical protein n=1 Tax=Streptomyces liangshanensis TaxID=2717324 RepID=UPI0036DCBF4C